ncbi:hypothetical protein PQX77_015739, partial [Marasmius sp. AFHP31]
YSRVDFQFHNTHDTRVYLQFSLRLPLEVRTQLRAAYLCQSRKSSNITTYFVDEIGFSITGNFSCNPTTSSTPTYLFIPPLRTEYIDGMYCVPYPLPDQLFYWSWDPEGRTVILKEDWEQAGIPKLRIEVWVGSYWYTNDLAMVTNHLRKKNYAVDGKQYTQDHGYPELIWGDPHNQRNEELEDMDSDEDLESSDEHEDSEELGENESCSTTSQYTSSSAFLLVALRVKGTLMHLGDRHILHARDMESSVEERHRVKQQQTRVQKTAHQANTLRDVAQKSNPNKQ